MPKDTRDGGRLGRAAAAIPEDLREHPRWVLWDLVHARNGETLGKPAKQPVDGRGRWAKWTDPNLPVDFERIAAAARTIDEQGWPAGIDGIGLILRPTDWLGCIDLDGCRDAKSGVVAPWAQEIVDRFDTWTEISVSGTGLHLFFRFTTIWPHQISPDPTVAPKVEVYAGNTGGRFIAMTGNHLAGTPESLADGDEALDWLSERYEWRKGSGGAREAVPPLPEGILSEEDVEALLGALEPDVIYPDWARLLFGLRRTIGNGEDAFELAMRWSEGEFQDGDVGRFDDDTEARLRAIWVAEERESGRISDVVTIYRAAGIEMPDSLLAWLAEQDFADVEPDDYIRRALGLEPETDDERAERERQAEKNAERQRQENEERERQAREEERRRADAVRASVAEVLPRGAPGLGLVTAGGVEDMAAAAMAAIDAGQLPLIATPTLGFGRLVVDCLHFDYGIDLDGIADLPGRSAAIPGRFPVRHCEKHESFEVGQGKNLQQLEAALCVEFEKGVIVDHCAFFDHCAYIEKLKRIGQARVVVMSVHRAMSPLGQFELRQWKRNPYWEAGNVVAIAQVGDMLSATSRIGFLVPKALAQIAAGETVPGELRLAAQALLDAAVEGDGNTWPQTIAAVGRDGLRGLAGDALRAWDARSVAPDVHASMGTRGAVERLGAAGEGIEVLHAFVNFLRVLRDGNAVGQVTASPKSTRFAVNFEPPMVKGRFGQRQVLLRQMVDHGPELAGEMLGREPVVAPGAPPPRPYPLRLQVRDHAFSAWRWEKREEATSLEVSRLAKAVTWRYGRTMVATPTDGRPKHLDVEHHTGLNGYASDHAELDEGDQLDAIGSTMNFDALISAGRVRISESDAHMRAAAISTGVGAYQPPQGAQQTERGRWYGDGDDSLGRPIVDIMQNQLLTQAMNREIHGGMMLETTLNKVHFADERTAVSFNLSNEPCPLLPPHFQFDRADLHGPEHMIELVLHFDGVLPLQPKWLHRNAPDVFESDAHAWKFIERVKAGPLKKRSDSVEVEGRTIRFEDAWPWRSVEVETTRSRGRKGKPVEAVTCLKELNVAEELLLRLTL